MDEVEPFNFFIKKKWFFSFQGGKRRFYMDKISNYFFESIALHWVTYIAQVFSIVFEISV